jgi:hypothetical protein
MIMLGWVNRLGRNRTGSGHVQCGGGVISWLSHYVDKSRPPKHLFQSPAVRQAVPVGRERPGSGLVQTTSCARLVVDTEAQPTV